MENKAGPGTIPLAMIKAVIFDQVDVDLVDGEYAAARALTEMLVDIYREHGASGVAHRDEIETIIYRHHQQALRKHEYDAARSIGAILVDIYVASESDARYDEAAWQAHQAQALKGGGHATAG